MENGQIKCTVTKNGFSTVVTNEMDTGPLWPIDLQKKSRSTNIRVSRLVDLKIADNKTSTLKIIKRFSFEIDPA